MKEILSDKMLHEMFVALEKGEPFEYSDANTQISINSNGISIQYKTSINTLEIEDFLKYCDKLDDDLFIEVCESFSDAELEELQKQLDTENYRNTISLFTTRVKEIAQNRLTEIINEADVEIKKQEQIIANAHLVIEEIHKELDAANIKYNV
jgi:hypothetical protein